MLQASDLPERERGWAEAIRGAADHLARLTTSWSMPPRRMPRASCCATSRSRRASWRSRSRGSLAARAQGKALEVEIDIAKGLPVRLSGDEVRLRSALENLVDNAVKFTERGSIGFAASSAARRRGRVRLTFTVTDSGIGITAAELKRLFRPFAQASESGAPLRRRRPRPGLRQAHRQGDGRRSRGDQQARPRQHVPADGGDEGRRAGRRAGARPGAKPAASLRVLCVEDNPYGRVVLSAVLRELGHRVSFVGSGEAAVETVAPQRARRRADGRRAAGIDGIEATRRIRALPPPAGRIPIIGVSGRTEPRDAARREAAGMNAYLRKPASPAELNEALRMAAQLKRA